MAAGEVASAIDRAMSKGRVFTSTYSLLPPCPPPLATVDPRAVAQKFATMAKTGEGESSLARLQSLSFRDFMQLQAVLTEIKAHTVTTKGNLRGTLVRLNMDEWER